MTKRQGEPINLNEVRSHQSSPTHSAHGSSLDNFTGDPTGEEAYQLAFHEAAKMNPPRIPNPLAYPNSPTAQAHIKTRTSHFSQPSTTRVPNSTYVPPPPDIHSKRRAPRRRLDLDDDDNSPSPSHSSSVSPPIPLEHYFTGDSPQSQIRAPPQPSGSQQRQQRLPPLPHPGRPAHGQTPYVGPHQQQYPPPRQDGGYRGPSTMEPHLQAPSGPRNPFR